jgi:hypothetical protein
MGFFFSKIQTVDIKKKRYYHYYIIILLLLLLLNNIQMNECQ